MIRPSDIPELLREARHRPARLLQLGAGVLLALATVVAVALWLTDTAPRLLAVVALFWVFYGVLSAAWEGAMALPDAVSRFLQDVGVQRVTGFSDIETLVARGHTTLAADRYAERAREPHARVEATLRRSQLLAGPLQLLPLAIAEVEALRAEPLDPIDDRRVGRRLAELHERAGNPGRAMVELRRLIDTYPEAAEAEGWRGWLGGLKDSSY